MDEDLMRIRRRTFRRLFPVSFISLLFASTALSENLLVNPGFNRDLAGWTVRTVTGPDSRPADATVGWTSADAAANPLSGGAAVHARSETFTDAHAEVSQCVAVSGGTLVSFGARFLTLRQYSIASPHVAVTFFADAGCSSVVPGGTAAALSAVIPPTETSSAGRWDPVSTEALVPSAALSARLDVGVDSTGTRMYGLSYVDAVADDAFLTATPVATTAWILPSSAWTGGAGGSLWTTTLTLSSPGTTDAAVTLKFLGHDVDGRDGKVFPYVVHAGETLIPDEETWQINRVPAWGAILVTSSSPTLVVQSEIRAPGPGGGSVGQALPALATADFATSTPKTLAPIRENASSRTNLVLANPTELPVTAHVVLYAADGSVIGTRDVDLPPLGMTQLNRVAAALGAPLLAAGRLSISTPTPGGAVAAYASVIDNVTNDPRTLLPR